MNCKFLDKHRALRWVFSIACIFTIQSCTRAKDDTDDSLSGFWIRLQYTYNILDVEAAPKYVNDAHVYVYDARGNYVKSIYVSHDDLVANNHCIRVEGLPEGDYEFVVWSGIDNYDFSVSGDTQTLGHFRLSLVTDGSTYNGLLPDLFYGNLSTVHYGEAYAMHNVLLTKNTNELSCVVVPMSDTIQMDPDDYTMKVVAANSVMDIFNQLEQTMPTTYMPFLYERVTLSDADYGELHGLKFGISTLRLMSSADSRIILERKSTGQTVFNISFLDYIGMISPLYTNVGHRVSVQEYLDRQDFYPLVFYLSGDHDQLSLSRVNR